MTKKLLLLLAYLLSACSMPTPARTPTPTPPAATAAPSPVRVVKAEAQEGASGSVIDLYAQAAHEFPFRPGMAEYAPATDYGRAAWQNCAA